VSDNIKGSGRKEDPRPSIDHQLSKGVSLAHFLKFMGIGVVVGVAYIDPGNWGTDIAAGSKFGYSLLWVVVMSNLMGMLLQYLSSKLGIVTGRSLAENCRHNLTKWKSLSLWGTAEIAAIATDLAEVIGAAIAINLLFGIPLIYGAIITGVDTLLILALERKGFRKLEAAIIGMVAIIGFAYVFEILLAQPDWNKIAYHAIIPEFSSLGGSGLLIAVGILGATVMPHAIYLHSSIIKSRHKMMPYIKSNKQLVKFSMIDTIVALSLAGLVNGAILVVSAATFHTHNVVIDSIDVAYKTLTPLLGNLSSYAFAIALLASGLASSVVATLSGQVIFEGFTNLKIKLWKRRIVTRLITLVPAIIAISLGVSPLSILVISQVVLSIQLPFTVVPLVYFTGKKKIMGSEGVNRLTTKILALVCTTVIISMNILLIIYQFFM
jgi:manganese transport protein